MIAIVNNKHSHFRFHDRSMDAKEKKKEKNTSVSKYRHECEHVGLMLIHGIP